MASLSNNCVVSVPEDELVKKPVDKTVLDAPSRLSTRHRLRFLAKDSLLYGGAAALNKAFALITFPLLARHFSVADYGLIDLFMVFASLLAIFFIFGQDSAVARFFYEYNDEDTRRQVISQSLVLQVGFILAVLPILWFSVGKLARMLTDAPAGELLLKLVLLQAPFLVLINFSQNLLKWTFARSRFMIISLGSVVLNMIFLLFAVLIVDVGVAGVFVVSLAVQIASAALGLIFVRYWLVLPRSFGFIRELLPYAIPYGVICCLGAFVPALERSVVSTVLGSHELGLYAAGAKVAMLISLVIQAFQTAWGPFSLAIHKEPNAAHTYNWVLKGFVLSMCVVVLLLSAIAQPVIYLLASDRYAAAAIVVFPLAMGLAIQATSWITEIGVGISKKSYLSLYSYTVFLSVTGLAIYVFANALGLVGVALGVMTGHLAKSVTGSWLAQRAYELPWTYGPIIVLLISTMAIGLLGVWINLMFSDLIASVVYSVGAVFVSAIGWCLLFNADDRRRIVSEIRVISV